MPEMEAPRIQQHAPLAQPTPTRQQGQRAGTAQEQDEQGGGDGVKKRRPVSSCQVNSDLLCTDHELVYCCLERMKFSLLAALLPSSACIGVLLFAL